MKKQKLGKRLIALVMCTVVGLAALIPVSVFAQDDLCDDCCYVVIEPRDNRPPEPGED